MIRLQLVWLNGLTVIDVAGWVGTDGYATVTSGYLEEIMRTACCRATVGM
jgi:hypothetical protein